MLSKAGVRTRAASAILLPREAWGFSADPSVGARGSGSGTGSTWPRAGTPTLPTWEIGAPASALHSERPLTLTPLTPNPESGTLEICKTPTRTWMDK